MSLNKNNFLLFFLLFSWSIIFSQGAENDSTAGATESGCGYRAI
jgi:hypothetical protein